MINNSVTQWMFKNEISPGDIVMATGAPKSTVSMTLKGERNDKRVIGYLRQKGCPYLLIENNKKRRKPGKKGHRR